MSGIRHYLFLSMVLMHCLPDYYYAKRKVDLPDNPASCQLLAGGGMLLSVSKAFSSTLYGSLLLVSAFVPDAESCIMVLRAAMTTYLYMVHLKPRTWVKNLSCTALIGASSMTSGLATCIWRTKGKD
jgi:hypothetical protein